MFFKFDGDVCGGVVLFVVFVIGCLIIFVLMGECFEDFELFYFDCMVSCIFDFGDILIFIE